MVKLANYLGVKKVYAVVNKVQAGQLAEIEQVIDFLPILGHFPYDPVVADVNFYGENLFDHSKSFVQEAEKIKDKIDLLTVSSWALAKFSLAET
ncbi:MAG: hypothetical protein P4L49_00390 [Desulfosporosinus sp.]|nr:hypothetical protein [Desulfosporosinus sp.]